MVKKALAAVRFLRSWAPEILAGLVALGMTTGHALVLVASTWWTWLVLGLDAVCIGVVVVNVHLERKRRQQALIDHTTQVLAGQRPIQPQAGQWSSHAMGQLAWLKRYTLQERVKNARRNQILAAYEVAIMLLFFGFAVSTWAAALPVAVVVWFLAWGLVATRLRRQAEFELAAYPKEEE